MELTFMGYDLKDEWAYLVIACMAIAGLVLMLSIGLLVMWIKYSWIERNNSKNWTGRDITEWIFKKQGVGHLQIESSFFYLKYFNHNKRRGTYKLRPWTHDRKSIWTLMEASQQAYATSIRETNGTTFWMIFRLPKILRFVGIILGAVLLAVGIKDAVSDVSNNLDNLNWGWIGMGISVIVIAYVIADCGRVWVMWRNINKLLEGSGLQDYELKAINRIFFWRLMYSLAVVILEIIKLVIEIAGRLNNSKSKN